MTITVYGPLLGRYGLRVTHANAAVVSTLQAMAFRGFGEAILWLSEFYPEAELAMVCLGVPQRAPSSGQ